MKNRKQQRNTIKKKAEGKWKTILTTIGIDPNHLTGNHGPCPWCGGTDRWRFSNWKNDGWGFCNQCDATGDGIKLISKHLGLTAPSDLPAVLNEIEKHL